MYHLVGTYKRQESYQQVDISVKLKKSNQSIHFLQVGNCSSLNLKTTAARKELLIAQG